MEVKIFGRNPIIDRIQKDTNDFLTTEPLETVTRLVG